MQAAIELLKREALLRRNARIQSAKRDYRNELKTIKQIGRSVGLCMRGRPRKIAVVGNASLQVSTVAKLILLEGHKMTLRELTLEVQRRGCRPLDDYRTLSHVVNSGLSRYQRYLKRDGEGRWSVCTGV